MNISVVIPLAPGESEHHNLLAALPDDWEVITASEQDRARSLNAGAARANGEYLWFLHADTQLPPQAVSRLVAAIAQYPDRLYYFDLVFHDRETALMVLNQLGAQFRSHVLQMPYGDQGLCIAKTLFDEIGGYPEGSEYGEDHLFVWHARQHGVRLKPVGATLKTSARKYIRHGWLKTTLAHQYLWAKQALPEFVTLMKMRMR